MRRTGAHRAERAAPAADRSNLIRVMPAQGGALRDSTAQSFDVAVAGGGVIGLAVAWRAAQAGADVVVLHASRDGAAWPVSAGMLAPVAEAQFGHDELLALGLESARRWPDFADEVAAASGRDPGYLRCGTLVVARDRDEAEALERELAFAPSATCPSSACCPPRPAAASPRWARACGWPSTCPATTRSTPARCATRWPRPSAAPAASCARARRWRTSPSCARWPRVR